MKPTYHSILLAGCLLFSSAALAVPTVNPGNGNAYEVVSTTSMNFDQARAYAESLYYQGAPGHLVSITSAEEQAFVTSLGPPQTAWIGGFQADNTVEPAAGWTWITGEDWDYTNWAPSEPNDAGGVEDCAHWWTNNGWNDINCSSAYTTMVVEWELDLRPVPTTSWPALALLAGLLLIAGTVLIRARA